MTPAQALSDLFAQERRLKLALSVTEAQIKAKAPEFCKGLGYLTTLRREALERTVALELAKTELEPTPLEKYLDTGSAFE